MGDRMKRLEKIGRILREAREEQGMSLNEVAVNLKISVRTIQAIEAGSAGGLPPKTFLRGFIQSYSNLLKLDTGALLKIFAESSIHNESSQVAKAISTSLAEAKIDNSSEDSFSPVVPNSENQNSNRDQNQNAKLSEGNQKDVIGLMVEESMSQIGRIGITLGILILIGLIVLVKKTVDKYEKEAEAPKVVVQTNSNETMAESISIAVGNTAAMLSQGSSKANSLMGSAPAATSVSPAITTKHPLEIKLDSSVPTPILTPSVTSVGEGSVTPEPTIIRPPDAEMQGEVQVSNSKKNEGEGAVEDKLSIVLPNPLDQLAPLAVVGPLTPTPVKVVGSQEVIVEEKEKVEIVFQIDLLTFDQNH